ncbi:hypothetical protein BS50DRAFT_644399, partial [Corynespora cassiicola Philippines]
NGQRKGWSARGPESQSHRGRGRASVVPAAASQGLGRGFWKDNLLAQSRRHQSCAAEPSPRSAAQGPCHEKARRVAATGDGRRARAMSARARQPCERAGEATKTTTTAATATGGWEDGRAAVGQPLSQRARRAHQACRAATN